MSLTLNLWINFLLYTELNSTLLGMSFCEFPVLKITQKYALRVSCFNVLFNFDHNWSGNLCLCNSVYEQNYWLIINVLILISYRYIMFVFIFSFTQHELPLLKCSEEDCLADFVLRKEARLNNPGACSLDSRVLCKYWQNICSNGIPKLKLQQKKGYLVHCGHLPALMKNKAKKHSNDTCKFGWRKSIKGKTGKYTRIRPF